MISKNTILVAYKYAFFTMKDLIDFNESLSPAVLQQNAGFFSKNNPLQKKEGYATFTIPKRKKILS